MHRRALEIGIRRIVVFVLLHQRIIRIDMLAEVAPGLSLHFYKFDLHI